MVPRTAAAAVARDPGCSNVQHNKSSSHLTSNTVFSQGFPFLLHICHHLDKCTNFSTPTSFRAFPPQVGHRGYPPKMDSWVTRWFPWVPKWSCSAPVRSAWQSACTSAWSLRRPATRETWFHYLLLGWVILGDWTPTQRNPIQNPFDLKSGNCTFIFVSSLWKSPEHLWWFLTTVVFVS